jgi:MoxR-like ATPase
MTTKSPKDMARDALIERMRLKVGTATSSEPTFDELFDALVSSGPFATVPAPVALDGQVLYSTLFGVLPPTGEDFLVQTYEDGSWDEEDQGFIPNKAEFSTFVVDHKILSVELRALQANLKCLIVGPTGSGKTTLQKFICAMIRQPYLRINGRQDMESDTLLGKPWVSSGTMEYLLGELPKAMIKGWFIAFDEPWKTPAGIQMALQRMYERDGILQLDDMPGTLADKQIVPKNTFRLVLADNVVGTGDGAQKYGATQIQDGSTLNRMDVVIRMGYLSHSDEVSMVMKMHPEISRPYVEKMVRLGSLIRVGYEQDELSAAFSPRNLDSWGRMAVLMQDIRAGFEATVLERYAEDSERAAVEEHYRNVFG